MRNSWSIIENIYVYYSYDGERIFLANPETKKFYGPVKKIAESKKDPELLENSNFTIKFLGKKVKLLISGTWYVIGNLDTSDILEQLESVSVVSGEVCNARFGFNPVYPDKTALLFPGSALYKESEKEFIRRTNLSLYKKTTKYIPGHKYDSENGTYLYLGQVVSHKPTSTNPIQYTIAESSVRKLHAFTNDIPGNPDYKEILTRYEAVELKSYPEEIRENTIFLIDGNKAMADLGEVMCVPGKFEDYWETKLENFIQNNKEPYSYGSSRYHYSDFGKLVQFFYISSEANPKVSDNAKKLLTEVIKTEYRNLLFLYYDQNIHSGHLNILKSKPLDEQENSLMRNLIETSIKETQNYYTVDFNRSMFKTCFDIELLDLAKISLEDFEKGTISVETFPDLIENFRYLEFRGNNYIRNIDFVYVNDKNRNFEAFLKNEKYRNQQKQETEQQKE